jgi:uroporphyrinogen decarboxylase
MSLYLDAIARKPVSRTPVWIMRQAGRYLPEYRKIREKYDFLGLCKTPGAAAEVTLQPIRRFGFDAAILFSDILVVPEAMGMELSFLENHGPKLTPVITSANDLKKLVIEPVTERLQYVGDTIAILRQELKNETTLIGFSGSPFTLATYMVEGKPTKNFKHIKKMLYGNPHLLQALLDLLTKAVTAYLQLQIEAGAEALQIFDTWGGILPPSFFGKYSASCMKEIVEKLSPYQVPITLFTRGGENLMPALLDCKPAMIGIDWTIDMAWAKKRMADHVALQGNLDPAVLYGKRQILAGEIDRILSVFGKESGHVFNLGHGIFPDVPVDKVSFLVDHVREQSIKLHQSKCKEN